MSKTLQNLFSVFVKELNFVCWKCIFVNCKIYFRKIEYLLFGPGRLSFDISVELCNSRKLIYILLKRLLPFVSRVVRTRVEEMLAIL